MAANISAQDNGGSAPETNTPPHKPGTLAFALFRTRTRAFGCAAVTRVQECGPTNAHRRSGEAPASPAKRTGHRTQVARAMPPGPSSNPPLDARTLRGTSRPAICSQALLRLRPTPTRITHPTPGDARARCHQVRARQGAQASAPPKPPLLASIPLKAIITLRLVCRFRRAEHIYGFGSSKRRPRYNLFYSTVGFRPIWLFADAAYKSLPNSLSDHHLVGMHAERVAQRGREMAEGRPRRSGCHRG